MQLYHLSYICFISMAQYTSTHELTFDTHDKTQLVVQLSKTQRHHTGSAGGSQMKNYFHDV